MAPCAAPASGKRTMRVRHERRVVVAITVVTGSAIRRLSVPLAHTRTACQSIGTPGAFAQSQTQCTATPSRKQRCQQNPRRNRTQHRRPSDRQMRCVRPSVHAEIRGKRRRRARGELAITPTVAPRASGRQHVADLQRQIPRLAIARIHGDREPAVVPAGRNAHRHRGGRRESLLVVGRDDAITRLRTVGYSQVRGRSRRRGGRGCRLRGRVSM